MVFPLLRAATLLTLASLAGCMSSNDGALTDASPLKLADASVGAGTNAAPGSPDDFIVNIGRRIYFKQGSSTLDDVARETLGNQAAWLKTYSHYPIKVEGFTDDPGNAAANMQLGFKRAEAAKAYLVAQGVDPGRIRVRSAGNTRPTMRCAELSCKSQNRHVRTVLDQPNASGQQPAGSSPVSSNTGNTPTLRQQSLGPVQTALQVGDKNTFAVGDGGTLSVRGRVRAEGMYGR